MSRKKSWVIADLHFGQQSICRFVNYDGSKMRPWDNVSEMDEALVDNWNSVVRDSDRVYVLGDVAMDKKGLVNISRCNGTKILIKGNHCKEKIGEYLPLFKDIRAIDVRYEFGRKFVMSHVPPHYDCLTRWGLSIHGHLHNNYIKLPDGTPDLRYCCVSVERINYTPKLLEQVLAENPL